MLFSSGTGPNQQQESALSYIYVVCSSGKYLSGLLNHQKFEASAGNNIYPHEFNNFKACIPMAKLPVKTRLILLQSYLILNNILFS